MQGTTPDAQAARPASALLGLAAVECLLFAGALLSWRKWPDLQIDYGLQLYLPWQICHGAVLYDGVKYLTAGPLSQYLNAGLFKVFGVSIFTLVAANLIIAALWLALLYRWFLEASDGLTAALICAAVILVFAFAQDADVGNYNYLTPYCHEVWHGLVLSSLALRVWTHWLERGRPIFAAGAGMSLGLVFLTKPEIFAALLAALMVSYALRLWISHRTTTKDMKEVAQSAPSPALAVGVLGISAAMPVLIFFGYFWTRLGNWQESARAVGFAWVPLLSSSAARSPFYAWCLGLDQPGRHILAMAGQVLALACSLFICAKVFRGRAETSLKRLCWIGLTACLCGWASGWNWSECGQCLPVLSFIACGVLVSRLAGEGPSVSWFPLVWSLFGLFLLGKLGLFSRIWHYGFVLAMPAFAGAIFLLSWVAPRLAEKHSVNFKYFRGVTCAVLAIGFLQLFTQTQQIYLQKTCAVGQGGDRLLSFPAKVKPVNAIITTAVAWLSNHTGPNSTVAALPEGALVNYLTRRKNSTGYLVWNPVELAYFGEGNMTCAFERNAPDYVVLLPRDFSEFGVGSFGQKGFGHELLEWIRENYDPVYELSAAAPDVLVKGLILKRTGGAGSAKF